MDEVTAGTQAFRSLLQQVRKIHCLQNYGAGVHIVPHRVWLLQIVWKPMRLSIAGWYGWSPGFGCWNRHERRPVFTERQGFLNLDVHHDAFPGTNSRSCHREFNARFWCARILIGDLGRFCCTIQRLAVDSVVFYIHRHRVFPGLLAHGRNLQESYPTETCEET